MKRVLFVATITKHITTFHIPYLKWFKENGYEVHVASNGESNILYCDNHFNLPIQRSPYSMKNLKAYKMLEKIVKENDYDIVHCHTPMGGVLARLATRKSRKDGLKVIYTAHGFHFYKGAPLINWMIYYPIEKYLSKYTDIIVTINKEDYERAKNKFKKTKVEYVPGVGIDTEKFRQEILSTEKEEYYKEIGISEKDFILTCVGELNKNKNQIMIIKAMQGISKKYPDIKVLLVGSGSLEQYYKKKIKFRKKHIYVRAEKRHQ
jgi:glycosyltransferase EpsD